MEDGTASKHDHLPGTKQASGQKLISFEEVQKHNKRDDCWVIIEGKIYDVTDFLDQHPGGPGIILANAGKDATRIFKPLHPPDALDTLEPSQHLGPVDPLTMPDLADEEQTEEDKRLEEARKKLPPVDNMLLVRDFEEWAEKVLSGTAWAYYRSAADSEYTFHENSDAYRRYFLRPRILRKVGDGDIKTSFVGIETSMPVFISPAAMAKLGHPLGEVNLTKGAGEMGIVQAISANASCSLDEIMEARKDGQKVIYQIYLNKDRKASEVLLQKVEKLKPAAVMFTVDVAWQSKRTMDVRAKNSVDAPIKDTSEPKSKAPLGVSQAIGSYQDRNLDWDDIDFIRKYISVPIIVKGVQSIEDVELCVKKGVQGVFISNHGGRSCDYAPAPIDVLYELRCLRPDLIDKIDILIDGGVKTGADVVKALALGAKAVGMGRPFLYANGTHGQEGVERLSQIMYEEITNTMRNAGVTKIADLKPEMCGPAGPWVGANRPPYMPKP
ncbi:putative cytochrome b2, mitochondrial precursor (L-lactate ferricytochrome C oxidoreductase) [Naematelia encephala]|uniref:L-lactate dehydrogenase (cytochrome) n=1 Tax=Naematelia encephala TaxID=71784 RepID=A0A1Y2AKQ4_9TREE|nr:putative cytochrome b2, mitochondrial precursor (L-lactate ferricytochrome C oxidoreductase) [Naematelia encephala]